MTVRTYMILALAAGLAAGSSGCFRLARTASRANRGYNNYQRNQQVSPEELRYSIADLDAASIKILNQHRAKWSDFVQRYEAAELHGREQLLAVVNGFNNAHWSEKPKPEDMVEPLGVAIGDVLKAEGNVNWVLAEGDTICLCSPNGKVAVAPADIADTWLSTKKAPLDQLIREVATAVRDTKGEPVVIGYVETRQYEPQLR